MYNKILKWLKDPSGVMKCASNINQHIGELQDHIIELRKEAKKTFEEVIQEYKEYAEAQKKKAQFYRLSLHSIGDVIPDMLWMKWSHDGTYVYANKSIRDNLLFDDKPEGKTDAFLGAQAATKFGADKHNFGSYCAGSDDVTISYGHRKRFIEYGMAGGKPLILEVYKNVVRNEYGDIIATVGSGRDITDNIFTMLSLEEQIPSHIGHPYRHSDSVVKEYLDKYLFENDTIDVTLREFYQMYKELYYG